MPKARVRVKLIAECETEIEVDYEEGEDPCDLTEEEQTRAELKGDSFPAWAVDDVELLG